MTREMETQPPTFIPEEWDRVYQSDGRTDRLVFAHGADRVVEACAELLTKDMLVVDAGCGSGRVSSRLASLGLRVLAVDRDPAMARFAKRRLADKFDASVPSLVVADAVALPLSDAACDVVVAVSLVGCLPGLQGFLAEVHRVLRPGGLAIMTFSNRQSLLIRINTLLQRLRNRTRKSAFAYNLYRHDDVARLLADFGFSLHRLRFYNVFLALGRHVVPPMRVAEMLERRLWTSVAARLARNFLFVAEKKSAESAHTSIGEAES
jgi:ubiquinone/menaquinone biosynthesis C-methylase UbiE